jgi:hypothetical protein
MAGPDSPRFLAQRVWRPQLGAVRETAMSSSLSSPFCRWTSSRGPADALAKFARGLSRSILMVNNDAPVLANGDD